MCYSHHQVLKKITEQLEGIRQAIKEDVRQPAIDAIKAIKLKGIDEVTILHDCDLADRFLKILNRPTPGKGNPAGVKEHLENVIRELNH